MWALTLTLTLVLTPAVALTLTHTLTRQVQAELGALVESTARAESMARAESTARLLKARPPSPAFEHAAPVTPPVSPPVPPPVPVSASPPKPAADAGGLARVRCGARAGAGSIAGWRRGAASTDY